MFWNYISFVVFLFSPMLQGGWIGRSLLITNGNWLLKTKRLMHVSYWWYRKLTTIFAKRWRKQQKRQRLTLSFPWKTFTQTSIPSHLPILLYEGVILPSWCLYVKISPLTRMQFFGTVWDIMDILFFKHRVVLKVLWKSLTLQKVLKNNHVSNLDWYYFMIIWWCWVGMYSLRVSLPLLQISRWADRFVLLRVKMSADGLFGHSCACVSVGMLLITSLVQMCSLYCKTFSRFCFFADWNSAVTSSMHGTMQQKNYNFKCLIQENNN